MTIDEIIVILQNRLVNLEETRKQAVASGLLDQVNALDADIISTKNSLQALQQSK